MLNNQFLQGRLDLYTHRDSDGELLLNEGCTLNSKTRILTKQIKLGVIAYWLAHGIWVNDVYSTSSKSNSIDSRYLQPKRLTS